MMLALYPEPAAHATGSQDSAEPPALHLPAGQAVHTPELASAAWPAGQLGAVLHVGLPVEDANVPGAHAAHCAVPPGDAEPTGHAAQPSVLLLAPAPFV